MTLKINTDSVILQRRLSARRMTEGFVALRARAVCPGSGTGVKQTHLLQQNKVTHRQVKEGMMARYKMFGLGVTEPERI